MPVCLCVCVCVMMVLAKLGVASLPGTTCSTWGYIRLGVHLDTQFPPDSLLGSVSVRAPAPVSGARRAAPLWHRGASAEASRRPIAFRMLAIRLAHGVIVVSRAVLSVESAASSYTWRPRPSLHLWEIHDCKACLGRLAYGWASSGQIPNTPLGL